MCLDNLEEIGDAVDLLKAARAALEQWTRSGEQEPAYGDGGRDLHVSHVEGVKILNERIAAAEERLRVAGFTGPVKRVEVGDAAATIYGR